MARGRGARTAPAGSRRLAGGSGPTSRGRRRRQRGARGWFEGGSPGDRDAAPRVPGNVELAAPRRAECLCAAAGAVGRWLLRSRSGREGNRPAGGVGKWEGRGRGGGGGRRTRREGGARGGRPEPAAPGWEQGAGTQPRAGAGRTGAGRSEGRGLGVWVRGGVWGPAARGGGGPSGRLSASRTCPLARSWGPGARGWGGRVGPPTPWSPEPL